MIPPAGAPAFGPLSRPQILLNGGQLGLQFYSFCTPQPGGPPCRIELDGLSFGDDYRFETAPGLLPPSTRAKLWFSVDKYAVGIVGSIAIPNVRSEAPVGDSAADVFTALDLPPGPLPPFAIPPANTGLFDGNGLVSGSGHSYPGVGLVEPTSPLPGPDTGDNIDALAIGPLPTGPGAAVYFSLDAGFIDPLTGLLNTDSASAQGVPAAAVLRKLLSGGSPTVWATPLQLGLDLSGPGTDDLDALILFENGTGVFEPSLTPYDWLAPGGPDMLLFSVRRGSALIGQTDSIFGLPIEPGDVLTTPSTPGGRPGIFIAAENLGLATVRSSGVIFGDDLDALASTRQAYFDCNHNGVEDAVDIASGASSDTNENGIPDECEHRITAFCYCPPPVAPCGNDDASAGCKNSTGVGGLLDSSGTTSVSTDDLVLTASQLNHNGAGLFLRSLTQTSVPFKDGLLLRRLALLSLRPVQLGRERQRFEIRSRRFVDERSAGHDDHGRHDLELPVLVSQLHGPVRDVLEHDQRVGDRVHALILARCSRAISRVADALR